MRTGDVVWVDRAVVVVEVVDGAFGQVEGPGRPAVGRRTPAGTPTPVTTSSPGFGPRGTWLTTVRSRPVSLKRSREGSSSPVATPHPKRSPKSQHRPKRTTLRPGRNRQTITQQLQTRPATLVGEVSPGIACMAVFIICVPSASRVKPH